MNAVTAGKTWIPIRLDDPDLGGVTVHPPNGDLYALSKKMIARSARLAARIEAFDVQLSALRAELERWSSTHKEDLQGSYLILKGDHFLYLVVLKGKAHDDALEDALTDLDLKIARDPQFDLINLSVLALPAFAEEAIRSFLPHNDESKGEGDDAERAEPSGAGQP